MTDVKTFDDTSPFKEQVLGDKPDTHEVVIANTSEIKDFYDPLTNIRFELKTETTVRIKGDFAHKQFLANIEQINTLNGSAQLVVSSDTNVDGSDAGNNGGGSTDPIRVTGITVTPKTKTLTVGSTGEITPTIEPANATDKTITWTTSDANIVGVDQTGAILAKATGKATITATTFSGGYTATTKVSVKGAGVDSVTVTSSNDITKISAGETLQLTATVAPDTATDKTVTWSSSDESIATVDANGLVTGVKHSDNAVTITATSNIDNVTAGTIDLFVLMPS